MPSNIDLHDRVVIVTGAGNGLGREYALFLAERGAAVVVNDVGAARDGLGQGTSTADAVVNEIVRSGGQAVASYDSVATRSGAHSIVETALGTFGRIDAVVNNAGFVRDRSIVNLSEEDVELVLEVHIKGSLYVSQAAFPIMKAAGFGRLVHTSSASGLFGNFGQANYAAAKAGIAGLSRTLAEEGPRYNILSNVVAPIARTRATEELFGPKAKVFGPEHVAPLVAYLVSPECTLTREVISAAGGRYARIFTGLTPGWYVGPDRVASPEDIAEHLDQILDLTGFAVPTNAAGEFAILAEVLPT